MSFVGSSTRARDFFHNSQVGAQGETEEEPLRGRFEEGRWLSFARTAPAGEAQMLAAAAQLRRSHPILARMSNRATRAVCRRSWAAGWANDDLLHALTHRPGAKSPLPSPNVYDVIHPTGWTRSRLNAWKDTTTGRVLPGHHQQATDHGRTGATLAERAAHTGRTLLDHVIDHGKHHTHAARELLARRRAGELADHMTTPTPPEHVASTHHRTTAMATITHTLAKARTHQRTLATTPPTPTGWQPRRHRQSTRYRYRP